nr:hypothetical protein [Tanacetum cinerariifolium]
PKPLKKQAQIEKDEAYARELLAEMNKNINWYDVIKQVASTPPLSLHQSPQQQSSSPPQQPQPSQTTTISMELFNNLLETCIALTRRFESLEQDKIAQALKITKLKQRVKKLEKKDKLKVFGLKRLRKVGTA